MDKLERFGKYVAAILPKYVQDVRITSTQELEILIHPEGNNCYVWVLTLLNILYMWHCGSRVAELGESGSS